MDAQLHQFITIIAYIGAGWFTAIFFVKRRKRRDAIFLMGGLPSGMVTVNRNAPNPVKYLMLAIVCLVNSFHGWDKAWN